MRYLLLLPFLLVSLYSFAQRAAAPDFIITTAGDTLRGTLRQTGKHNRNIRLDRAGQATAGYGAADIASFGSGHQTEGVSRRVGARGGAQFMHPLVRGYVSLYTGKNEQQDRRYYLQLPDSTYVIEVALVNNQLILARNLPGCSTLVFGTNEIQRQYPYSTNGLSSLVMDYNRCRQPGKPTQRLKYNSHMEAAFGVKAGLNTSYSDLSIFAYSGTRMATTGYQLGGTLNLSSRTHFSVQLEATYLAMCTQYSASDPSAGNSGFPSNALTTQIHYAQLQVPLLVRYTVGYGVLRPYFNAGPTVAFTVNNSSMYSFPLAPASAPIPDAPIHISRVFVGYVGGVGLELHAQKLPVLTLEARYDRMIDPAGYIYYTPQRTALRLEAGLVL